METRILIELEIPDEINLAEFKNSEEFSTNFASFDRRIRDNVRSQFRRTAKGLTLSQKKKPY